MAIFNVFFSARDDVTWNLLDQDSARDKVYSRCPQ